MFAVLTRGKTVYPRLPHPAVDQDEVVDAAREWIQDLCDALKAAFWEIE